LGIQRKSIMRKKTDSESGGFNPRLLLSFALCSVGMFLAMFSFAADPRTAITTAAAAPNSTLTPIAGSWSLVTSPNVNSTGENSLFGVACTSLSDCWAVGAYFDGSTYQTLTEQWDGNSWQIVASPNGNAPSFNVFFGLACTSALDCWAAGYYNHDGSAWEQTFVERWNVTSWGISPSPNTSATLHNYFEAVTCTSASDCWAVGYHFLGVFFIGPGLIGTPTYQTLIEHWDGASWTITTSPNTSGTQTNILSSVTCTSASNCWAVGRYAAGTNGIFPTLIQTLIEHWDGNSWTIVPSPNTLPAEDNYLAGVTCASATNCWAVGYHYVNGLVSPLYQTLIEHWNGTSWSIVTSPNTSPGQANVLFGTTCASASDCWAVGYYVSGEVGVVNAAFQTLIERWDGTAWSIVSSPNTGTTQSNALYNVECAAPWDCWAVGHFFSPSGVAQTLTEHYTAPPPTPTSVVSRKTHGSAGTFDIDLPLSGDPGIECRSGGANGEHDVVFAFAGPVPIAFASCNGTPATTSSSGNETTVHCTGISNTQSVAVSLGGISVSMDVLLGDVTANKTVSNTDVASVKAHVAASVTSSNFRNDVSANGIISNTDVSTTKAQVGTSLP
jgi:hypothetical protein